MWDTLNLLPVEAIPESYLEKVKATPQCESFMHLHLGFDAQVSSMRSPLICVSDDVFTKKIIG